MNEIDRSVVDDRAGSLRAADNGDKRSAEGSPLPVELADGAFSIAPVVAVVADGTVGVEGRALAAIDEVVTTVVTQAGEQAAAGVEGNLVASVAEHQRAAVFNVGG